MNKISFIIEFDEVSKTQEEQLTEFIEKTGIKFHVLESDNDLKKYNKYKEAIDKAINDLNVIIDIVREQPLGSDCWIIDRLEANKSILKEVE